MALWSNISFTEEGNEADWQGQEVEVIDHMVEVGRTKLNIVLGDFDIKIDLKMSRS